MTKQDLNKKIDGALTMLGYAFWAAVLIDLASYALWGRCTARWLDPIYIVFAALFVIGNATRYVRTDKSDETQRWASRFGVTMWTLSLLLFIASYRFPVVAC